jgi:hypothetical protein
MEIVDHGRVEGREVQRAKLAPWVTRASYLSDVTFGPKASVAGIRLPRYRRLTGRARAGTFVELPVAVPCTVR